MFLEISQLHPTCFQIRSFLCVSPEELRIIPIFPNDLLDLTIDRRLVIGVNPAPLEIPACACERPQITFKGNAFVVQLHDAIGLQGLRRRMP